MDEEAVKEFHTQALTKHGCVLRIHKVLFGFESKVQDVTGWLSLNVTGRKNTDL